MHSGPASAWHAGTHAMSIAGYTLHHRHELCTARVCLNAENVRTIRSRA